jgi:histidine triad (HIT) family protein
MCLLRLPLGDRPFSIVARDELSAILVTREQRGVPHLLVVPVAHRETVIDLSDQEATAVILGVRDASWAIDKEYARPGIAIWQNNGIPANQAISHVHFHVAGTLENGGTSWGEVRELSIAETDIIAERIRTMLSRLSKP